MRILIASQYFPPEITAGANRLRAFAAGLARRGHEVEVVCEVPSHPTGVIAPGYGGRFIDRRRMDGFEVSYVWVRATPSKSFRARLTNYASYAASAAIAGAARRRPDVILASSPPLSVGSVGAALAGRHRVPWVLDVRDLWPEVAVVVGEIGPGRLLSFAERLERRLYASADAVTVTTENFRRVVGERGGAGKTKVIRNGAAGEFLAAGAAPPDPAALESLGAGDPGARFTWAYAGNLGIAQGLESAVEAARELGEGYRLLLVGEGPRREALRRLAAELPPGRVELFGPVPSARAAAILRAADALLVPLAATPGLGGFVPSKLFEYAAVGRPLVLAAGGEAAELAGRAGAALCVPPEDSAAIAAAVRDLSEDSGLRERLSLAARRFGEEHSRERAVEEMERVLGSVARAG